MFLVGEVVYLKTVAQSNLFLIVRSTFWNVIFIKRRFKESHSSVFLVREPS